MSFLTYRGIKLDLLKTQAADRHAVHSDDGIAYLYTEWVLDVIGELNPALISFATATQPRAGLAPAKTDQAIRHLLMQPFGRLVWTVGDTAILDTGVNGVDADNGPTPLSFDVLKLLGEHKTWVVRYRIKARVNECKGGNKDKGNMLLSNRWTMRTDTDDQHVTTRIIRGEAKFNSALLNEAGLNADQFRAVLVHPVPQGFRRENVDAEQASDGNTYRYTVIDQEDLSSLQLDSGDVAPGITDVQAFQTNHVGGTLVTGAVRNVALLEAASFRRALEVGSFNPAGYAGVAAAAAAEAALRSLPTAHTHFLVRVWGNKKSRRRDLQRTALKVILSRFDANFITAISNSVEAYVTHDLRGRYVEVGITIQKGVLGAGDFFTIFDPDNAHGFPDSDDITGVTVAVGGTTRLGPPNSSQSRGTYVENLISQALQEPCELPQGVADPPLNVDVVAQ
jgi:hypothetical protein